MLKISDENSLAATVATYWKRFAALATGFARKYRTDVFVRTETNIIALQIAYVLLILLVTISSLIVLYHDIISSIANVIATLLTTNATAVSNSAVIAELERLRAREISLVVVLISAIAIVFGYLVAHFALKPAREARNTQKQFIGNVAHELRTPLSIIKANTEIRLLDTDVTPAARALHESNLEELDRISHIINNLLTLNTLIRPERVPFQNVEVVALAKRVAKKLKHLTDRKNLQVNIPEKRRHYAYGNVAALEQILTNIITNAVRYTEEGTIAVLFDETEQGQIQICVRDTGVGIKKEDLTHILEPFYRGDVARTRGGGTASGLGLTIVSELVKLHRGRLSIQSTPGEGTEVTVAIPRGVFEKPTARPKKKESEISADFSRKYF